MADEKLTRAQQAAVDCGGNAVLVSAAAGSGKTKVLVDRLMRRLCRETDPKNIDDFLIITFTKKAAGELRNRIRGAIAKALAKNPGSVHLQNQLQRIYLANIGTIDSFCGSLLREYAHRLNLPADFRQVDRRETAELYERTADDVLNAAYEERGECPEFWAMVNMLGSGRDDKRLRQTMLNVYEQTGSFRNPAAWLETYLCGDELEHISDAAETGWGSYQLRSFRQTLTNLRALYLEAIALAETDEQLQKAAELLRTELAMSESYLCAGTWDELFQMGEPVFGTFSAPRKLNDPERKERVLRIRNLCKSEFKAAYAPFLQSSAQVLEDMRRCLPVQRELAALVNRFSEVYLQRKLDRHMMEFGDVEQAVLKLLLREGTDEPTAVAREISARFTEILVDEYQDTNEVQDALFRAISDDGRRLFMVGDVKQSIYSFRRANPEIFVRKYKAFPDWETAPEGSPLRVTLSENFRSRPGVLEAANAVFSACMSEQVGGLEYTTQEALKPGRPSYPELPYPCAELHCIDAAASGAEKTAAEASFVAARIRQLLDDGTPVSGPNGLRPAEPGDIVLLLRGMTAASVYAAALERAGIPCLSDNPGNLLVTEETECMLHLLRLTDNLHDDIAMAGAMMSPVFGFSADRVARIKAAAAGGGSFSGCVLSAEQTDPEVKAFLDTFRQLRKEACRLQLHETAELINRRLQVEDIFSLLPGGEIRRENIRQLLQQIYSYEAGGRGTLSGFLSRLDSSTEKDFPAAVPASENAVRIMTVHKSKGLEFPIVFLPDLSRRFNAADSRQPLLLHPELGCGFKMEDGSGARYANAAKTAIALCRNGEMLSEELRILYVAMTRPENLLIMSYSSGTLQSALKKAIERTGVYAASKVSCPGDWVLQAAVRRIEAGELLGAADTRPEELRVSPFPWVIRCHTAISAVPASGSVKPLRISGTEPLPLAALRYSYPGEALTVIPTKVTATQLKGRHLDEEVSEQAAVPAAKFRFRSPSLMAGEKPLSPQERGIAMHLAMQYIRFEHTGSVAEIREELARMERDRFLTKQQCEAVDPEKIRTIFAGDLGKRISGADRVIREFKFSISVDAGDYFAGGAGEKMLLQGVTDCCLITDGALTVIDFKTDRVSPGGERQCAEKYRGQLAAYSTALSRIFGLPVRDCVLYFFATDTAVSVQDRR